MLWDPQAPSSSFLLSGHGVSNFSLPHAIVTMSCLTAGLTNHGLKLLKLRAKINLFGRPRRAGWDYGRAGRATGDGRQRLGKVGPGAGEAVAPGEAATSLLLHRRNPGAATALPAPRACSPRCTPSGNRKPLVKGCGNGSSERNRRSEG